MWWVSRGGTRAVAHEPRAEPELDIPGSVLRAVVDGCSAEPRRNASPIVGARGPQRQDRARVSHMIAINDDARVVFTVGMDHDLVAHETTAVTLTALDRGAS